MSQGDFIAAQFFRFAVKMSPAHPGTEIAGRFLTAVGHLENICFKNRDGNMEQSRVALDFLPVDGIITRIHYQKYQIKGYVTVPVEFLHQLCHQHGIFTAGDADGDPVSGLDQLVLFDGIDKRLPKFIPKFFDEAPLDHLIGFQCSRHLVFPLYDVFHGLIRRQHRLLIE